MIKISEIGGLYQSTPENLRDAHTKAFMYACDRQFAKLLERAERVKVWCAIEQVEEKYLDLLAAENRVHYYDAALPPETKRQLILNAFIWHMYAGTPGAVEELVQAIFGDGKVQEWFEYGGKPYRFKILTNATLTPEINENFSMMIEKVKNVRSLMDSIIISRKTEQNIYTGIVSRSCSKSVIY